MVAMYVHIKIYVKESSKGFYLFCFYIINLWTMCCKAFQLHVLHFAALDPLVILSFHKVEVPYELICKVKRNTFITL